MLQLRLVAILFFEHVELVPSVFWDYLIWYDPYNYGGLAYENQSGGHESTLLDEMNCAVNVHWHIAEFLPAPVQQTFLSVVAEFLDTMRQMKENDIPDMSREIIKLIETDQKRQLLKIVKDIHHDRLADAEQYANLSRPFAFPKLPGSCRTKTNPDLEFLKMITMVFQLNKNLEKQVQSLRKELL